MTTGTVSKLEARSHDNPDETRKPDKATVEVNNLGDYSIGRFTFQPGWTWESSIDQCSGAVARISASSGSWKKCLRQVMTLRLTAFHASGLGGRAYSCSNRAGLLGWS